MDDLLNALADAVRTGSAYAMPALIGYYVVRVVEAVAIPVMFVGIFTIAGRTVRAGMTIYHEKNIAVSEAKRDMWRAEHDAIDAQRKPYIT